MSSRWSTLGLTDNGVTYFGISEGEWQGRPVFRISARCGHEFQVFREADLSVSQFLAAYGEDEKCPDCHATGLVEILEDADYRLNPDGPAQGVNRLLDSVSVEVSQVPRWLTTTEAAEDLKMTPAGVWYLCSKGRIEGARQTDQGTWLIPTPVRVTHGRRGRPPKSDPDEPATPE